LHRPKETLRRGAKKNIYVAFVICAIGWAQGTSFPQATHASVGDEFSTVWNTDVKAGLVGIQAALRTPMRRGGRVLVTSSGAAMVLAVPFIKPDDLSLSGGYIGAKRMLWFMAHSANKVSRDRNLGIHFQVLAPMQLIAGTTLGHEVAAACAEIEGVSIEELVMQRYGSILRPAQVGEQVAELLGDPRYMQGVAYGFRNDCDLQPLDV
jgi:NAD(P)-dependent dehydrogenase (short-subunit alcohol dehydrogenase family)